MVSPFQIGGYFENMGKCWFIIVLLLLVPDLCGTASSRYFSQADIAYKLVRRRLTQRKLEGYIIYTNFPVKAYQIKISTAVQDIAHIIYYYNEQEARICMLYCKPGLRSRGYGSQLMYHCLEHLQKKKTSRITLQVCPYESVTDEIVLRKLISFYEGFGFTLEGRPCVNAVMIKEL